MKRTVARATLAALRGRRMRGIGLAAALLIAAAPVRAHPHAWVDLEVELVFAADGRLQALRQSWVFDEAYTAYMLPPLRGRNARAGQEHERHAAVARELLANLRAHGQFTRIEQRDVALATTPPPAAAVTMRGRRMVFGFELPLAEPADPRAAPLVYAVFDPTYFVEILHARGAAVRLIDGPRDCTVRISKPTPDAETIARAAALEATQSGGDTLGQSFAERVTLRCG